MLHFHTLTMSYQRERFSSPIYHHIKKNEIPRNKHIFLHAPSLLQQYSLSISSPSTSPFHISLPHYLFLHQTFPLSFSSAIPCFYPHFHIFYFPHPSLSSFYEGISLSSITCLEKLMNRNNIPAKILQNSRNDAGSEESSHKEARVQL